MTPTSTPLAALPARSSCQTSEGGHTLRGVVIRARHPECVAKMRPAPAGALIARSGPFA
jgi:hypothetical protein